MKSRILCLTTCLVLTACGQASQSLSPNPTQASQSVLAAQAAKARKLPLPQGLPLQDGHAARRSALIAERALGDYLNLTRRWERTYGDRAKDAIEEQMLRTLKDALDDVQRVTSREGRDEIDRRAYDLADRGLDRYELLYREWRATYGREQARLVVNEMLRMFVDTLEAIRDNA
ncbi:MAG: hypothetical protein VKP62_06065 [Candidatus Sericytochromatia bacterium]|nr:hypothetical protein [Candidatus Sericytochromatia bacterium]